MVYEDEYIKIIMIHCHMLTEPVAVEIDGDERWWNCEIIDQRKQLDEERQLLGRRDELTQNTCTHNSSEL